MHTVVGWSRRAVVCVATALAIGTAGPAWGGAPGPAASPAEALAEAGPLMDSARKAKSEETPEIVKGIRRAVDVLRSQLAKGRKEIAYAAAWNEALTLSRFHANSPPDGYVMEPTEALGGQISFGLPVGCGWTFGSQPEGGERLQCHGAIVHKLPDGRTTSTTYIYRYGFNVLYSGIGGENAAGLADLFFEDDKAVLSPIESRSQRVLAKPLSKHFNRSHYYEAIGKHAKLGKVRRRHYFAKGSQYTFQFEVEEERDTAEKDTPFVVWQKGALNPELEAVLNSIDEPDPKKSKDKK